MLSLETGISNCKNIVKSPSLTLIKANKKQFIDLNNKSFKRLPKRVSPFPSFRLSGSMTLEACMVLPIFLFFMMTLLLSIEAVRLRENVWEAMHQAGSEAAFYGYETVYGSGGAGHTGAEAMEQKIKNYMQEQLFPYLCLKDGAEGLRITDISRMEESGNVELLAEYSLKPFIFWLPIGGNTSTGRETSTGGNTSTGREASTGGNTARGEIILRDKFFGHAWVGYRGDESAETEEKEIYVYITETGSRYHFSENCTALKLTVRAVREETAGELRNQAGGKYYPCERCKHTKGGLVYLTESGSSYHGEADCPSLKRTVYIVPLSEAGDRTPCGKCG